MPMSPEVSAPLASEKFKDPTVTADGTPRACVELGVLQTLWINTGTLCNLECTGCYIESSPKNDRLAYIRAHEVAQYFDEIERGGLPTREIGFTGGEPFMNPEIYDMLGDALARGFDVLVLTNAMRPMMRAKERLLALREQFGEKLTLRVSIDHPTQARHEEIRGEGSWQPMIEGLRWLAANRFRVHLAGRTLFGDGEDALRRAYGELASEIGLALDPRNPAELVLFPEMDERLDVPEISTACWDILKVNPADMMCASSRMVVKRKGANHPVVVACTLLPYDPRFELGRTLDDASGSVALNHPHCARFCVLGGGSCSA
ncbi:MAG: radical SAM protein [Alphaproteobacteria bacterium]|nr:MAG: radical SAM protein [Alphaproteobacteria bacterium]